MVIELKGNRYIGFAYDYHMINSEFIGYDELGHRKFNNTRSEMGELVYQLKYQNDKSAIVKIIDLIEKFKGLEALDMIIPVPPSNISRQIQPVIEIAKELGSRINVLVRTDVLGKNPMDNL